MNFWEAKEWIEAKTYKQFITDKLLSRIEYLKLVGSGNYSEEKYRQYLKAMGCLKVDARIIRKPNV